MKNINSNPDNFKRIERFIYSKYIEIAISIILLSIAPLLVFIIYHYNDIRFSNIPTFFFSIKLKDYYILFCSVLPALLTAIVTILVNKNNMELAKMNYINNMRNDNFPLINVQCKYKKEVDIIELKLKNVSNNIANNIKISNRKVCDVLCGLQEETKYLTYSKKTNIDKSKINTVIEISESKFHRTKSNIPYLIELNYYDSLNNHLVVRYEYNGKTYAIKNTEYVSQ